MLLAGCTDDSPDARFERYLGRLEHALDGRGDYTPAPDRFSLPTLPRTGQLRLELAGSKLDALDFLALSGCAVQVTIGKRNSSLGRMASASQRLLLELEYLQLAPACVQRLREKGRRELAELLDEAWRQKREQVPALIFNATLGGTEYRDFWQPPARLGDYPAATSSGVLSALEAVNGSVRQWLDGNYRFDNLAFELLLSEVAKGDGGALLKAEALQAGWLATTDAVLAARLQHHRDQGFIRNPNEKDVLKNVVLRFFIGDLQPWLAAVDRRRQSLLPAVRELENLLADALPPAYRTWQAQRDRALTDWSGAPRRHVHNIQALRDVLEE